ncbi:acetate--CoA ligase family protein [Nonomuraea sp. NPDC047897]|uniref:acetate--CoA ligase family protein n=1 Tax=Nonomuraea sp. NPDC047897 TaxID=3364346 RepID=UPI0037100D1C
MSETPPPTGLDRLFTPRSIAVVGASDAPGKAGHAMMTALETFSAVYPVNTKSATVAGRKAYAAVGDVPEEIDLAVLVVPPAAVPHVLEDCASAGVGAAVVCSGGFAETGPAGRDLQERVHEIATSASIRVLGPNTSGFLNPAAGVFANFMPSVGALRPGPVGIVAQSGGMNLALSFMLHQAHIGVSLAIGLGNAIDVGFIDALDFLVQDPHTKVISLHIEGVANGAALVQAVRRAVMIKPVVVLKVGRTDVSDFAQSHTGALIGGWALTRSALAQAGAVVVDTPRDMVDALAALAYCRLPASADPGIAIITGQAGPGLFIADQLRYGQVRMPDLSSSTARQLAELLPPMTYQRNPVDTGRPEESFDRVVAAVRADDSVDGVLVYALQEKQIQHVTANLSAGEQSGTVFVTGGREEDVYPQLTSLRASGIPVYAAPDSGVTGMKALVADARARARSVHVPTTGKQARVHVPEGGPFDEDQAKTILADLGLASPSRLVARSHDEAHEAMAELGAPVVVKLCDAHVQHKSDIGAVHIGVRSAHELTAALERIDAAVHPRGARYLIERQAPSGTELIIGAARNDSYGPVVLLGVGGIDVESFGEPAMRLAPLTTQDALEMISELPQGIRTGARGRTPVPDADLAALLIRVAALMIDNPHVNEVDINPVRVVATGLLALDALILTG